MIKANFNIYLIASAIVLLLTIQGCGDETDSDTAELKFDFEFQINDEDLAFGQVYDLNGSKVSFKVANYYIGGLKMTQTDDAVIDLSSDYLLAGPGNLFTVGDRIPATNIVKFDFFIGVDETTNNQTETDFTSRPSSDPLGMKDPSMHWNWNSGYKFVRIDGEVDTDGDDLPDTPISYHIGSNPLLKNISISTNRAIDDDSTISFVFDMNEFFESVDFKTVENQDTHTGNNLALAQLLVSNLESALSVD